ncbi:MAG TPA: hypothetical protein VMN58_12015 [Acidimicrobiales bacterium]|nr:hypothetical protein [Acidimicrobiales bacterium]
MPARSLTLLLAAPLLALALAACGDDDAQQASSGDTTTTSPMTTDQGTGDSDDTGDGDRPDEPECAGAGIMTTMEFPGDIPEQVATTLLAVRSAAQRCDYDDLAELALADGTFTASFGEAFAESADLAAYWRAEEGEREEPITAIIVHLTTMSRSKVDTTVADGAAETLYVAPRALHDDDDEAARQEVVDVFGEEAEEWFGDGQYLGWRLGFTEDGEWRFFVFGD